MTDLTSPEQWFGFRLGSDGKIARWDRIIAYFSVLDREHDGIKVIEMGPSTEGNPFLLVIISSPKNLLNLEHFRTINAKLSDPRGLCDEEVAELVKEGRAVICQSMSLHANELGGTQMAPELAYDLLNKSDNETQQILQNVIFLMIPCFNPDGQIMVTDWYNKWQGTEYEGGVLPWLYHKYAGHDNNRDAAQTNLIESKYAAKILFRDWNPQVYQDHHQMSEYGPRLYVAPYCEPMHPYIAPIIWREHSWYGAHMAYKLEEAGKTGIVNAARYNGWGGLSFNSIGNFHNITSMLTESASAKLASPIYINPTQLRGFNGGPKGGLPHYKPQINFPNPWPGGWWRLRDIIEQQKIATWSVLDIAAKYRETVLRNAVLKAKRQIERGAAENTIAYLIPRHQHDPLTMEKLIRKLAAQGIEIKRATTEFSIDGTNYSEGTYAVFLEQPKMGLIKTLLGRTFYPNNVWTIESDGSPRRPYDTATDNMAEFMGVRVDPTDSEFTCNFETFTGDKTVGKIRGGSNAGYLFDPRLNDSFIVVNRLLKQNIRVWRAKDSIKVGDTLFPSGSFGVTEKSEKFLKAALKDTGVDLHPAGNKQVEKQELKQRRLGIYQGFWRGNFDEGWTRWLLDHFEFPYTTLKDEEIKKGGLNKNYDVIILPNNQTALITGQGAEEWWRNHRAYLPLTTFPQEYRSGIGEQGVKCIKEFVQKGGTLVAFNESCDFCIDRLGLSVKNLLNELKRKEFFCPGSMLKAKVDNSHPLAYGMPEDTRLFFWNSPAFEILPTGHNEKYKAVITYPERDILQSGWLIGEEKLAQKTAMLSVAYNEGRIILIGFRPQHRGQTHGTFKIVFNALI